MTDAVCKSFISGGWGELNRFAFVTIKYHNPEILIFQHIPIREKVINPQKNNRLEAVNPSRNGVITDSLNSFDNIEIVKGGGSVLEVFEGLFGHTMQ